MKRKKTTLIIFALFLIAVLAMTLGQSLSIRSRVRSPQTDIAVTEPPNPIPGVIINGTYMRIGINKGGTFIVTGEERDGGDVGFQYPIGDEFESLASGWYGEGYVIAYKVCIPREARWDDRIAYWWPDLGWPPPAECRMVHVDDGWYQDDDNRAVYWSKMKTVDGALELVFGFSFVKEQMYVELETFITNTHCHKLKDVLYKRIVDWDIHRDTDDVWTSDAHAAYATKYSDLSQGNVVFSVAGYTKPDSPLENLIGYVDLFAWDDIGYGEPDPDVLRGPGEYAMQGQSLEVDGCAAIYYDLWDLSPWETRNVWTIYQAGWNEPYDLVA